MLTKPLTLALILSLSFNGLFGYLSYKFHSDKAVAESKLGQAVDTNKTLQSSYDKQSLLCKVTDDITTEYQEEKQGIAGQKEQDLNDLDKLVSEPIVAKEATIVAKKATLKQGSTDDETSIVDIDGKLPESLRVLLSKSCHNSRGEACPNT